MNARNLDPRWFEDVLSRYEGTRLGRQEIIAEIVDDMPGALWTRDVIDRARFHCGPVKEIRLGAAALPDQPLSIVGCWAGSSCAG